MSSPPPPPPPPPHQLKVGSFNILADGLSRGEFFCEGGDACSIDWTVRRAKIVAVLANMLETCDAVVTQENDHFIQILEDLAAMHHVAVAGVFGPKKRSSSSSSELGVPRSTFQDESPTHAAAFARTLYGLDATDAYPLDHGVGIYFRTDRLVLENARAVGVAPDAAPHTAASTSAVTTGVLTVVPDMEFALVCTFRAVVASPVSSFRLYGAHLCSGENVSKELRRCGQLERLFRDNLAAAAEQTTPPVTTTIVAMDSNSSAQYESAYPADAPRMSALIAQFGFVDAVALQQEQQNCGGNECFKMRHGQGDQPSKHYQFMFDAIDKILVPAAAAVLVPQTYDRFAYGFRRYDPRLHDELRALRASTELRAELSSAAAAAATAATSASTCSVATFDAPDGDNKYRALRGLYPNLAAPSDHPPVSCALHLPVLL